MKFCITPLPSSYASPIVVPEPRLPSPPRDVRPVDGDESNLAVQARDEALVQIAAVELRSPDRIAVVWPADVLTVDGTRACCAGRNKVLVDVATVEVRLPIQLVR
jgi:hypothetical protein